MTLIRGACFAKPSSAKQIDFDDPRMELRDFREIHVERPHCIQWRVNDNFLLRSGQWSHGRSEWSHWVRAFAEAGFRKPIFQRFPWRYFWLNRANYVIEAERLHD